jgi:hypothetical protein
MTANKPGPKRKIKDAVRVTLYLDAATVEAATEYGGGNISVGVRLKFAGKRKVPRSPG